MRSELSAEDLGCYVASQVGGLFPDGRPAEPGPFVAEALHRLETCVRATRSDYRHFWRGSEPFFNHLNSDLYAMFLYLLANSAYRGGASEDLCEKLFLLNKALHALDVFYAVELPNVFVLAHPVGTVLGRATYGDHLLVYQRVTVGSSHDVGDYPTIGRHVTFYAGAAALGSCDIGDRCTLAAGAFLLNRDLPAGSLLTGAREDTVTPTERRDPIWA